jgi:hypothetical protein
VTCWAPRFGKSGSLLPATKFVALVRDVGWNLAFTTL